MHSTCPQAFHLTLAYTSSATSSWAKQRSHSLHTAANTAALKSATAHLLDALALALLRCFLPSLLNTILLQYHPAELQKEVVSIDCNMFTSAPRMVCFDSGIYISAKQTLLANPRSCPFQFTTISGHGSLQQADLDLPQCNLFSYRPRLSAAAGPDT